MTLPVCSRQKEVADLLARGHWPHACPAELRAHLADCRTCSSFLVVTETLQQARSRAIGEVSLPAAGAIWWRAQLRRRNAAIERAARPILGAYVFALAFMMVATVAIASSQATHGLRWLGWLSQSGISTLRLEALIPSWFSTGGSLAILISVLATAALVGAVVMYFAAERP